MTRLLALLVAAATPASAAAVEGVYVLQGVREATGAIELLPDGRFRFALTLGALAQRSEGRFQRDGNRILLTTQPPPTPPRFAIADVTRGPAERVELLLIGPDDRPVPDIDIEIMLANGARERLVTTREPIAIALHSAPLPAAVRFTIPVFGVSSELMRLDLGRGHAWRFRLEPNDIDVRDFRDEVFTLSGACLVPRGAAPDERYCRQF